MTKLGWLKHAFAVDTTDGEPISPEMSALLDRVADEVKRRRLDLPAQMFLEMSRPLNRISAQVLHFFHPIASCLFSGRDLQLWAEFLERRDAIDELIARLDKNSADLADEVRSSSSEHEV